MNEIRIGRRDEDEGRGRGWDEGRGDEEIDGREDWEMDQIEGEKEWRGREGTED